MNHNLSSQSALQRPLPRLLPDVVFSSRRRASRSRAASKQMLPDWVWGAGIGVIVLIFIGAYFLVTQVSGGSGSTCDKALSPLGTSDVTAQAFVDEDASLGRVINFLNQNDQNSANATFFGPPHNFTHNVDPPLRQKNEQKAKDLCNGVIKLEDDLANRASSPTLAADTTKVRDLLRDAAVILGYPRPG